MCSSDLTTWHADAAWLKPSALTRALLEHPAIEVVPDTVVDGLRFENETLSWQVFRSGVSLVQAEHVVLAAGPGCTHLLERASVASLAAEASLGSEASLATMASLASAATSNQVIPVAPFDAIRGQVTWGLMSETPDAPLPSTPINGRGSFVPHVPTPEIGRAHV